MPSYDAIYIHKYVYAGFACICWVHETRKGIMKGKEALGRWEIKRMIE